MERSDLELFVSIGLTALFLLIVFALFPSLNPWNSPDTEEPFVIRIDFDGDSSWDASYLADCYDTVDGRLDMNFGEERCSTEYSSFLATKVDVERSDQKLGPLSDAQAEKLLELSKDEEGSVW